MDSGEAALLPHSAGPKGVVCMALAGLQLSVVVLERKAGRLDDRLDRSARS